MKRASQHVVVEGTQQECFDALVDYESFPSWQRAVRSVDVVTRDEAGRGEEVAFEIDAKLRTLRYTLDYVYERPHHVSWSYVEGDPRDVDGELVLENSGEGATLATYSLHLDPGMWLPGPVVSLLNEQVMQGALEDLKARVEAA